MAVSETIVGAGAALAGVLITMLANFLLDKRRHHWEDERRWAEVKRAQYVDLLGTSRSMFDALVHAGGVQARIVERGKGSLQDHRVWVDFHAGQEVLAQMEERIGKWARESYIGWDELEIIAPWEIYDAAWQHFGYLRVGSATLAKAGQAFESEEHYDPADPADHTGPRRSLDPS
jgi:hypothetical protein